ncbi:tRNA (cytidine(34)-2'-O)-methyltransferase [Aquimarina agarilytica]|uniref:tRNA (cytidine(34)-2'-O)-methyltransferase n=1 Tax=Aquimarina agarilytica TaxID=1087449 RepID=UPI000287D2F2|nr:tRNA (cytidine(34)-2'-O)-methyltransferase [Aquimarina agarilytica]
MLNIVLIHPEIPNNTGNIGRLCVGTNCHLHLVHPLGFQITDKNLKRSGLDYWPELSVTEYENFEAWKAQLSDESRVFLFTSHAKQNFLAPEYKDGDWLVFGRESKGLESEILDLFDNHVSIPSTGKVRSFNIANAVSFAIGEALKQINGFQF